VLCWVNAVNCNNSKNRTMLLSMIVFLGKKIKFRIAATINMDELTRNKITVKSGYDSISEGYKKKSLSF